jgi:osmotically-inducible protein OsmY
VEAWSPRSAAPDDATLVRVVQGRISGRPGLDVSRVSVAVEAGALDLSGTVATLHERAEVERLASAVRGLVSVRNRIEVDRKDLPDSFLEGEVARALGLRPRLARFRIRASVNSGILTLQGVVDLARDREDAEEAGARVPGIQAVRNELSLAPVSVDPGLIRRRLERLLANKLVFGGVDDLVVEVSAGGAVSLSGVVVTHADRIRAERLAYGLRGVSSVRNDLAVRRFPQPRP